jgi:hypothetical protein
LRATDVLDIGGRSHLRLGKHPVLLPPAVARLVGQQATAAAQSAAPDGTLWLFPGRVGLRPLSALAMTRQLNQHGIHLRAGRTAALVDLVSLLGLHPATADRWSRRIASDWTAYLHARTYASYEPPRLTHGWTPYGTSPERSRPICDLMWHQRLVQPYSSGKAITYRLGLSRQAVNILCSYLDSCIGWV